MFKSYNNFNNHKVNIFRRIARKFLLSIAKSFPLNSVRIGALRLCGFHIGEEVYIGPELIVVTDNQDLSQMLYVGDRVAIAPRVTLIISSDANWSRLNDIIPAQRAKITIGNDSWIGAGTIILPGVEIGEMSVVGAASLVNKNIPIQEIHAGVPAKLIRKI